MADNRGTIGTPMRKSGDWASLIRRDLDGALPHTLTFSLLSEMGLKQVPCDCSQWDGLHWIAQRDLAKHMEETARIEQEQVIIFYRRYPC
jgi:hypothetical protein